MTLPFIFQDSHGHERLRRDERKPNYDKLNKGLGLKAMSIPDVHEDTATMGAMANETHR